jgi:hypothetical protein
VRLGEVLKRPDGNLMTLRVYSFRTHNQFLKVGLKWGYFVLPAPFPASPGCSSPEPWGARTLRPTSSSCCGLPFPRGKELYGPYGVHPQWSVKEKGRG